jgi:hypothetical protein
MTKVLTVRIPPDLLTKAEARASRLGIDRAKYVRSLIEEDLEKEGKASKRRFASEDLVGCCESPYLAKGTSATNSRVRAVMRQRHLSKREKNR